MSIKWRKGPPPDETGRWLAWYPAGPVVLRYLRDLEEKGRTHYSEIAPPEEESPAPSPREDAEGELVRDLYKALEAVQWVVYNNPDSGRDEFCPECRNERRHGHYESCSLAAILAKARGEGS